MKSLTTILGGLALIGSLTGCGGEDLKEQSTLFPGRVILTGQVTQEDYRPEESQSHTKYAFNLRTISNNNYKFRVLSSNSISRESIVNKIEEGDFVEVDFYMDQIRSTSDIAENKYDVYANRIKVFRGELGSKLK